MDCKYAAAAKDDAKISSWNKMSVVKLTILWLLINNLYANRESDEQKLYTDLSDIQAKCFKLLSVLLPRLCWVVGDKN